MTDQIATLTTEGDVSIITLNDGKANVFSPEMSSTVSNLLDQVPGDKGSLVITGRPGIFSAGFDLKTTEQIITECCTQLNITTTNVSIYAQSKTLLNNLNIHDRQQIADALDLNESANNLT